VSVSRRSRYIDGPHNQVKHKYTDVYERTVYRKFPGSVAISYTDYTWVDGDRIDFLSAVYLKNSFSWWQIMDINPEIIDPFNIAPGTVIRIPRVS
jgi:nucleoid-associated protein YgaU